jgi:uroporphyrin-III C-methyltransferase/precorrin-2 dehydrogenase/sirohydrochlorin ferrochelatase
MRYFPLFLDLRGRDVTVVGGGIVAERKIALLLLAEPNISVVSPALCTQLTARVAAGARPGLAGRTSPLR